MAALRDRGVQAALTAALLFGAATPVAKSLLGGVSPWLLAGLLYCGSGVGLGLLRLVRRAPRAHLTRQEVAPLAGAVLLGGVVAPVLQLVGLTHLAASSASLLLNTEGVFTALLAWVVFKENVDRRIAAGMAVIVAGAVLLSVPAGASTQLGALWPTAAVLGACLCWGLDNNLTRKVALTDATWLAAVKGLVAGPVNLALAFTVGARLPALGALSAAVVLGFFAYGVSFALFIVALRHVGTARAGAYYSVAPFAGAVLALAAGDRLSWQLPAAAALMGVGMWLHLSERHRHWHVHQMVTHTHPHSHDAHHQHTHTDVPAGSRADVDAGVGAGAAALVTGVAHTHEHTHTPLAHVHVHYPDVHHRHRH